MENQTNNRIKAEKEIKRIDKKLSRKYPVFVYEIFEHAIETRNERLRGKKKELEMSLESK